jgi:hypothetical protein
MNFVEIFGYAASVVIAVGMLMKSIRLLRWINLAGATMFSIYGFVIGALPVALLNGFIAVIDIFYLISMYSKKDFFKVLTLRGDNKYLIEFLEFYKKDIQKFFPDFYYKPELNKYSFFILRNMAVAGVILAREYEPEVLKISLDFTVPQYRDFKVGKFVYTEYIKHFIDEGYKLLITFPSNKNHIRYIKKMGFVQANHNGKIAYIKNLT